MADALLSRAIAETLKTPAGTQLRRLPDDVRLLQGHVRIGTLTPLYGRCADTCLDSHSAVGRGNNILGS